jgi:hypothetical protein
MEDLQKPQMGLSYLRRSLRLSLFFLRHPPSDSEYNPRMWIPSKWEPPPSFNLPIVDRRLRAFQICLHQLFQTPRAVKHNLSLPHRHALDYLRSQTTFLVVHCDKNLGPALIEREKYIDFAIRDHLSDHTTYRRISTQEATFCHVDFVSAYHQWLQEYDDFLLDNEKRYLRDYIATVRDPFPCFYLLFKVHKAPPLKTRPIVSYSGSFFYGLGVWCDHYLKQMAVTLRSSLRSSFDLRSQLASLVLPPNRRYSFFTADATAMYTNIDTERALSWIRRYLDDNPRQFAAIPIDALISALRMIMTNNIFQFGDTFWHQLSGTAMGAPPAPSYATVCFGVFEEAIIDDFRLSLLYYKRYIDDVLGIWIHHPNPIIDAQRWTSFQYRLNSWDGLEWVVSPRTTTVDFLDVTLTIAVPNVTCTLYEKPLNHHLYLPPRSAHPPGVLLGLISGTIYRIRSLCSDPDDANSRIVLFWRQLRERGYSATYLRPLFSKVLDRVVPFLDRPTPSVNPDVSRLWFFKLSFHPQDPPSRDIRRAWESTVANPPFSKPLADIDLSFNRLGHRRFVVCYKRPPNLGNLLSYRKLKRNAGPPVSSFL